MSTSQINPLLIQQLLQNDETIQPDASPTSSLLPGKYVRKIIKNKESVVKIIDENFQMLTCKSCGRKGKYDVGMLAVNIDENVKEKGSEEKNLLDHIQTTGYFRCKHCNSAGNWEFPNDFMLTALISMLPLGETNKLGTVGKNLLFDGSWHRYTTDAEEHLLKILKENPLDSFVWNRLGNLYKRGNRPELAISVFEHSIMIDPSQIESQFTIGDMLAQISDLPNAGFHLRRMLLYASTYKKMPAEQLREMLANGLKLLFLMNIHTDGEIPISPTEDEILAAGQNVEDFAIKEDLELEIDPENTESFYPFAELYMGIRAKEIPLKMRTLNHSENTNNWAKQRMEKQRKQRLKKKKKK